MTRKQLCSPHPMFITSLLCPTKIFRNPEKWLVIIVGTFLPFLKWGGFEFSRKRGEGGGSDFSHKKGGVGKIGGCFEKGWFFSSLFFILTNPFQYYLLQSEWWFLFSLFTPYLSVFFVFHGKNLFLLNLINRFVCVVSNQSTSKKPDRVLPPQ